jgi:hypothetical protein
VQAVKIGSFTGLLTKGAFDNFNGVLPNGFGSIEDALAQLKDFVATIVAKLAIEAMKHPSP